MSTSKTQWSPDSWRLKNALQQPSYPDAAALEDVLRQLARLPPLVTSWEIESLKSKLALAAKGDVFILQGGDCAESFEDCESDAIAAKLKILLQMSLILIHGTRRNVVRIGRFAGQYAKPRSEDSETVDGVELPSYRGDLVNRAAFSAEDRIADPQLLLRGYERAALTLNFIRALAAGGFADLHHPEYLDLSFVKDTQSASEYGEIAASLRNSVEFMEALTGHRMSDVARVDFYTSHEGLSLLYEAAQTRRVPRREGWYNLSTHLPWIGKRTSAIDGAHVEYFRGISNPVGVKIGADFDPDNVLKLLSVLNPQNEPGRTVLIHRFGAEACESDLPGLLKAVKRSQKNVTWICDPMHGNTEFTATGQKTRRFDAILKEVEASFAAHKACGTCLAGIHFELTGDNVTECIGGARGLAEVDLSRAYRSQVDPRLNYEQSLEMALKIAQLMRS